MDSHMLRPPTCSVNWTYEANLNSFALLSFWVVFFFTIGAGFFLKWKRQVQPCFTSLPLLSRLLPKIWWGVEVHNKWNHLPSPTNKPMTHCSGQWGCQKSQPLDKVPAGFHLSRLDQTWEPSTDPVNIHFGMWSLPSLSYRDQRTFQFVFNHSLKNHPPYPALAIV